MFCLIKTFWKHCHFSVFQHFPLCLCLMPMSIWFCSSTVTPPKLCSWYLRVPYLWIFSLLSKISGGSGGASYLEVTVEIMVRDRRHPNKCIYYPQKATNVSVYPRFKTVLQWDKSDHHHPDNCIYYLQKLQMSQFIQDLKPSCYVTKVIPLVMRGSQRCRKLTSKVVQLDSAIILTEEHTEQCPQ